MPITARLPFLTSRTAGFALICLVLAGFSSSGCSRNPGTNPQQAPAEASAGGGGGTGRGGGRGGRGAGGGGAVPVVTAHVVAKPIPVTIPGVGTAEPLATVQIRAQVTGQLSKIHFTEGQDVQKGAPLFTLDARPFDAALQQAEAVLARDTAQAKNAQSQRVRYEDLFKRGLIPRDQYETQMATAAALESTLAADQATIENAKLNLQYTRILAPISGRTGALNVHEGDLVRANDTTPLVIINQVAPIYVTFSVPGRYLPDIRRYQAQQSLKIEARITPGGTPGAPQVAPPNAGATSIDTTDGGSKADPPPPSPTGAMATIEAGTVSFIDNSVDPTTGTIKMKGTFANADHALWPGLFVQVTLILRTDPNAIVVPSVAVQSTQAGQFVFVVTPDRTAEVRNVTVERQQGDESVITNGLRPGEEVVTDGQLRLTTGSRVTTGTRGDGAGRGRSGEGGRRNGGGSGSGDGSGGGRRGGNRENQS
jgi:membrane fusion protein, multidrug efflux system